MITHHAKPQYGRIFHPDNTADKGILRVIYMTGDSYVIRSPFIKSTYDISISPMPRDGQFIGTISYEVFDGRIELSSTQAENALKVFVAVHIPYTFAHDVPEPPPPAIVEPTYWWNFDDYP